MKKIFLALAAVSAIFASCSKDDNNSQNTGDKSLYVQLPGSVVPETRMVDSPSSATTETSISANSIIYLMNNTSVVSVEDIVSADIVNTYKKFENVPATVNGVLVVANIPTTGEVSAMKLLTSASAIEKYAFSAASQTTAGVTGKVLMGKNATPFVLQGGNHPSTPLDTDPYYTTDVALNAITARFEIGTITAGTGVKNVKMEGVWMNNIPHTNGVGATCYTSTDASWNIVPAANTVGSATAILPMTTIPSYTPAAYHNLYNASVDGTSKVYAFQIFAGNYVPHVIMLVSGQYDNNDYFLGWLTFNYFTDNDTAGNPRITEVKNNMIYKLSGFVCDSKNITVDPELTGFDLGVKCTITPWTVKNLTPGIE